VIGAAALYRLPIDAVPDITNNQVQINVKAPALSPELVEKQVAFPIETALAGIPGLETPARSAATALPRSRRFSTTRPTSISRASR
jgi:Cu/Ag efflux pump CusA